MKLDPKGERVWVTEFGSTDGALLFDAVADSTYLYAAGRMHGALPGHQSAGSWDAIVAKIRLDTGAIEKTHQLGAGGIDGYGNVTLDDAGNLYLSGAGSPPGGVNTGDNLYLVVKLRADDLGLVWRVLDPVTPDADKVTEAWGGITYIPGAAPGSGRLVVGGWYRPPGNPPAGADGFLTLYGDLDQVRPRIVATHRVSSPGFRADWILDNVADRQGNIYAAGFTTGDLAGSRAGDGDMFVVKLDPNLQNPRYVQWGTSASDMFRKLEIDEEDNLYAVGYTYGNYWAPGYQGINADPRERSGDVVIQKLSPSLDRLAAAQFGTEGEERGFAFVRGNGVFVAGLTEGSLGRRNRGSFDLFTLALDANTLRVVPAPGAQVGGSPSSRWRSPTP